MISEQEAKEFFHRYIAQCLKHDSFIETHVKAVVRTARFMAEADGMNVEEACAAAWLHDIGYCEGKEGHAKRGLKICREAGLELSDGIADAIENHGNNAMPKTTLGWLLKKADKLSLLDEGLLRACYPKDMKLIKELWLPMIANVID